MSACRLARCIEGEDAGAASVAVFARAWAVAMEEELEHWQSIADTASSLGRDSEACVEAMEQSLLMGSLRRLLQDEHDDEASQWMLQSVMSEEKLKQQLLAHDGGAAALLSSTALGQVVSCVCYAVRSVNDRRQRAQALPVWSL